MIRTGYAIMFSMMIGFVGFAVVPAAQEDDE